MYTWGLDQALKNAARHRDRLWPLLALMAPDDSCVDRLLTIGGGESASFTSEIPELFEALKKIGAGRIIEVSTA